MSDNDNQGVTPGAPPPPPPTGGDVKSGEDLNIGLKILSFCIPLAGLILYFVKKDKEPVAAKSACTWAVVGFSLGIIINVIITILNN
jgi:hypothetical protein